ncbi:hypothetical protein Ga0061061_10111 [Chelatococcus sambhunathii]|uniref:Uncharacterized protein n=1 Tax=Chelatococcus sambhunathii TaxID=363953 RepID=A0ABM9TWG5_9HYPH|nr:hypothetical protein Ga0061061_10111 [Chelatococcus sambhunathii]
MANEPQLTPREARQGRLGRPVLVILLASLTLAVLAWLFL